MKKPTSMYLETSLVLAMHARGIELSPFFNRVMALFLDVPEDPNDNLIKKKTDLVVSTILLSYQKELQKVVDEHKNLSLEEEKNIEKSKEIFNFGEILRKTSSFPAMIRCLRAKDIEDSVLESVTKELNGLNGERFEELDVWNKALVWYSKYGEALCSS